MKFRLLIISKFSSYKKLAIQMRKPVDSDEDEYAYENKGPEEIKWFIIHAESRNKQFWNMFTNIFYMFSFFSFPYTLAFNFEPMSSMLPFEFLLDLIMLCDISTEFITTKEKDGRKITTTKELTMAYLKTTFFFDIMACLPSLITLESEPVWYMFKIFRYLQMPRLFD